MIPTRRLECGHYIELRDDQTSLPSRWCAVCRGYKYERPLEQDGDKMSTILVSRRLTCGHQASTSYDTFRSTPLFCYRCDKYRDQRDLEPEPNPPDEPGTKCPVNACSIHPTLPGDAKARKEIPLARGLMDYFPAALAEVAALSKKGNDQHNPGQEMYWAREKSTDHADCILRHMLERGMIDTDGVRHSAKVAWRALAMLQIELEQEAGAPKPRGAK